MPLLLDSDYAELVERGIDYVEDDTQCFLVLRNFPLPKGIYIEKTCDVLVIIPTNYNQAGIDMLWTHPHLTRVDGKGIPRMSNPGAGENKTYDGKEYCRWSRHWNQAPVQWQAGKDNVTTIIARIVWVFNNPDAKQK